MPRVVIHAECGATFSLNFISHSPDFTQTVGDSVSSHFRKFLTLSRPRKGRNWSKLKGMTMAKGRL